MGWRKQLIGRGIGLRSGVAALGMLAISTVPLGCSGQARPQAQAIAAGTTRVPVILIPGVEASTLVSTYDGKSLWDGAPWRLLFRNTFTRVADPLLPRSDHRGEDRLVAADIIRGMLGTDFYGALIADLERRAGGRCALPGAVDAATLCVLFPWDWRRDLTDAAAGLDRLIAHLRAIRRDPDLRVDLVGHSAGGMVVRYFIRYRGVDVLDRPVSDRPLRPAGADRVRRAALIGVPSQGSLFGLGLVIRGHRIGRIDLLPEHLAMMQSALQLLPHPRRPWLIDTRGHPLTRDLYDPATWQRLRISVFSPDVARRLGSAPAGQRRLRERQARFRTALERGRRFQLALSRPLITPFEYDVFAADCSATAARLVEEAVRGRPRVRTSPQEIARPADGLDYARLMYAPGDGWVTRESALGIADGGAPLPLDTLVLGCGEHAALAAADLTRRNLLATLAVADLRAQRGAGPRSAGRPARSSDPVRGRVDTRRPIGKAQIQRNRGDDDVQPDVRPVVGDNAEERRVAEEEAQYCDDGIDHAENLEVQTRRTLAGQRHSNSHRACCQMDDIVEHPDLKHAEEVPVRRNRREEAEHADHKEDHAECDRKVLEHMPSPKLRGRCPRPRRANVISEKCITDATTMRLETGTDPPSPT